MQANFFPFGGRLVALVKSAVIKVLPVLVVGLALFARGAPPAQAEATTDIASAGPLTHIYVGAQLGCQVAHTLDGTTLEFFAPSSIPGDCGTFLFVDGTMFAPDLISHPTATGGLGARTPFTAVSQTGVTGAGTLGDPYKVITVVDAGTTGIRLTQTDSYVVGQESYRTDTMLSNTSGATKSVLVYHAADCFLGGSDIGFGYADAVTKTVACTKTANNTPQNRIEQFSPITPADHYFEAFYSSVWSALGAHTNLPDTCACASSIDNGIAINWDRTIPDGASATLSLFTTFSPLGNQPLFTTKAADSGTSTGGGTNGYTITITNPNATAVTVNTIQDTLPAGFSYVAGSTTGVTTSDPGIVGQVLTWTGPFTLAGSGSISLHFNVLVASTEGTYFNDASATATGADVVPTGPTAPITVTAPPCTASLTLSPSQATNPVNTPHTVTATATCGTAAQSGVTVNFTVTGSGGSTPNPASGSCVTDVNGQCVFTYTSATAGSDTIDASATISGQPTTAQAAKTWTSTSSCPSDDDDDFDDDGSADDAGDEDDDGDGQTDADDQDDDNDGLDDASDGDDDNDGEDDINGDGDDVNDVADDCDLDDDDDGVEDAPDNCDLVANASQADQDGDGNGDECDDGDSDGFTDATELRIGTNPAAGCGADAWPADIDGNGFVDTYDITQLTGRFELSVSQESPRYDIHPSGFIDTGDIADMTAHFSLACS